MEIEIFDIPEIASLQPEDIVQHNVLALSLNLDVQAAFSGEAHTICPFVEWTAEQRAVYMTMFPTRTPLSEFPEFIPPRVLEVVEKGVQLGWWTLEQLRVQSDRVERDPVLVAMIPGTSDYLNRFMLIARWGDALLPWPELREAAAEKLGAKLRAKIDIAITKLNGLRDGTKSLALGALLGGSTDVSFPDMVGY